MANEARARAFAFIRERKSAFQLTFRPYNPVRLWRWAKGTAFRWLFDLRSPAHMIVLRDLAFFCRANESCVVPGDRDKTLMLEGRREVFLRIQQHLDMNPDELFALYSGNAPQPKDTSQ